MTPARDNIILVVVNLDPFRKQDSYVDVPIDEFGEMEGDAYQVHDLLTDARYSGTAARNYVELDPEIQPAHIFRVRRYRRRSFCIACHVSLSKHRKPVASSYGVCA